MIPDFTPRQGREMLFGMTEITKFSFDKVDGYDDDAAQNRINDVVDNIVHNFRREGSIGTRLIRKIMSAINVWACEHDWVEEVWMHLNFRRGDDDFGIYVIVKDVTIDVHQEVSSMSLTIGGEFNVHVSASPMTKDVIAGSTSNIGHMLLYKRPDKDTTGPE